MLVCIGLGVYSEGVGDVVETGVWCDVGGNKVMVGMSDGCIVVVVGWGGLRSGDEGS